MGIDVDDQIMGRVLFLPVASAAGETAALRGQVLEALRQRRTAVVEEMCAGVRREGLGPLLETGGVALERRLDDAVQVALSAWERRRPLRCAELDALRAVGSTVACAGIPLWRLLDAVQHAARAGWDYVVEQALAVVEDSPRPRLAARLVADLSVEMLELVGRMEGQIAAGYGEVVPAQRPSRPQPVKA
ncbi:MAG TPA: hypothetical protein VN193_07890 [Candidatus Angelobacter sp.]|jgi:hypothetical protein|nr:hypothetical protein [Candidatus Angelobacter sp.]